MHTKAALLCHSFREYLTLSLTTWIPSISDIPEAQEDCLRVLSPEITPFPVLYKPCSDARASIDSIRSGSFNT